MTSIITAPDATVGTPGLADTDAEVRPGRAASGRLVGVDIARGIALLGMAAVHVSIYGPNGETPGPVAESILFAPSGQASVLFFILSGLSLSLIAGRGSGSASPGVLRRRGAVLILGGLLLSSTIWGPSILEHYGVMFLLAPWLLRRSDRALSALSAAGLALGPIGLLLLADRVGFIDDWSSGPLAWFVRTVAGLWLDGTYPLIVWAGFFALGLRLGRFDLASRRVAGLMLGAGIAVAVAVTVTTGALADSGLVEYDGFDAYPGSSESASSDPMASDSVVSEAEAKEFEIDFKKDGKFDDWDVPVERDPASLIDTSGHSGRIGWTLRSSAIAAAILGAALLLPAAGQRLLRPLAALGSISLSAYLIHIVLVTDGWEWLIGYEPTASVSTQIWTLIGIEVTLLALASLIVWRWKTGPAERGLKALTGR